MSMVRVSCTREQIKRLDDEARERKVSREDVASRYLAEALERPASTRGRTSTATSAKSDATSEQKGGKS